MRVKDLVRLSVMMLSHRAVVGTPQSLTWMPHRLSAAKHARTTKVAPVAMAGRFNLKEDDPSPSEGAQLALSFEPFQEVAPELSHVSHSPSGESFARTDYHPECEVGVNEQINVELSISYVYLALNSFASRDDVGLPGLAAYFEEQSDSERGHAKKLLKYQNKRGGRVKLHTLVAPDTEFTGPEDKGDALYMMELALSLEKLNFRKLRALHDVAVQHNDPEMADFLEEHLLLEQTKDIREVAVYVSQLRRAGQGLGFFETHYVLRFGRTWLQFDKYLGNGATEG